MKEWHPYFSFRGCDGKSELRLLYTLSVNNTCFKDPGSPWRLELGGRGHYPFIDGCSHPLYFTRASVFSFLKWFFSGSGTEEFSHFLSTALAHPVSSRGLGTSKSLPQGDWKMGTTPGVCCFFGGRQGLIF